MNLLEPWDTWTKFVALHIFKISLSKWNFIWRFAFHSRLRQFLIKFQAPETKTTKGWSVCFKDSKNVLHEILAVGHGRAVLASTAESAQFWQIGQNWSCYPAWSFYALFARISCNTFLESLRHIDQPWVGFVSGAWNFIKNCLSLLCHGFYYK